MNLISKYFCILGALGSTLLYARQMSAGQQSNGARHKVTNAHPRKMENKMENKMEPLTPAGVEKMIVAVIDLTNAERAKQHLPPLKRQDQLEQAAKWMAQDMADRDSLDHIDSKKRSISTRLPDFGYKNYESMGENIAAGQPTPATLVNGWMNSAHHRANILNPEFREIGIGVAYTRSGKYHWYWVQDLGVQFNR